MANGDDHIPEEERIGTPADKFQLNAYELLIATKFQRFYRNALIAIAVIGVSSGVALAGFAYVLVQQRNAVKEACANRNEQHDNAINSLIEGSDIDQQNALTEETKAEIRRRRDVTIGLIDAVAPKRDCDDLTQPAVKTELPPE